MSATEGRLALVGGSPGEGLGERVDHAITRASQYLFATQHARNFGQGSFIEVVRAQDRTVFPGKEGESFIGSQRETRIGASDRLRIRRAKLRTLLGLFVEADQPLRSAIAVDVLLRQHRAQPAFERSAAGVRGKLRNALSLARSGSVEIGIERVGQVAGGGIFAGDTQRSEIKLLAITREKNLPGGIVSSCASPG